jgi:hypothetical protein
MDLQLAACYTGGTLRDTQLPQASDSPNCQVNNLKLDLTVNMTKIVDSSGRAALTIYSWQRAGRDCVTPQLPQGAIPVVRRVNL